jgi:GNAT superfamily N-acetyltransferase
MSKNIEWRRGEFVISTDHNRLDLEIIYGFLKNETYWARNRTPEIVRRSFENSLPFVVLRGDETIGFARVVTDYATFGWIADVFIRTEFRGQGLSKWLMQTIIEHPGLQTLRRWTLATRDAHELYRQFGFDRMRIPQLWMERAAPDAYRDFEINVEDAP